ncbi:MAG: hypothetical protein CBD66_003700 [Flavobacteriaceae bacterium TMED206]|nr:MAG: hypothetical protein CBD66_003700 [Flavobacteriaceae bacterium TMED206]
MFTAGQIVFALFFFISFMVIIFFSYKKDRKTINIFYRDSYKILFAFILFFFLLFCIKYFLIG